MVIIAIILSLLSYFMGRKVLKSGKVEGKWTRTTRLIILLWSLLPIFNLLIVGACLGIIVEERDKDWWNEEI